MQTAYTALFVGGSQNGIRRSIPVMTLDVRTVVPTSARVEKPGQLDAISPEINVETYRPRKLETRTRAGGEYRLVVWVLEGLTQLQIREQLYRLLPIEDCVVLGLSRPPRPVFIPTRESSAIEQLAYDAEQEVLHLTMTGGNTYRYSGVPVQTVIRMLQAESLGTFFNESIRGNIRFRCDLYARRGVA